MMSINKIESSKAVTNAEGVKKAEDSRHRHPVSRKINSDKEPPVRKTTEKSLQGAEKINDQTVEMIADYIAHVKAQSEVMVKFYPPFTAGSEDRIKVLLNFAAFRSLIEKLTVPPEPAEEVEAELKSLELKKTLTSKRIKGLTQDQSQFTELY